MDISSILNEENINLDIDVKNREECLNFLIGQLDEKEYVSDKKLYMDSILEREKSGTTAVGFGIAIPHGKSSGVLKPVLSFARVKNPIDWKSLDGSLVKIVFLIGVPLSNTENEHIKILTMISRKLIHQAFRDELINAKNEKEVISILEKM